MSRLSEIIRSSRWKVAFLERFEGPQMAPSQLEAVSLAADLGNGKGGWSADLGRSRTLRFTASSTDPRLWPC